MAGIRGRQARSYFHLINTAEDRIGEVHEKLKGKKLHHCRLFLVRAQLLILLKTSRTICGESGRKSPKKYKIRVWVASY